MNKREFLKYCGGLALVSNLGVSFAKENNNDINLLVVFLRGGADGLSMLVPYSDNYYYESRPNIAIKKEDCFVVNETFGINKKLSFFNDLHKSNQLAIIPAAGQLNNSRSHFQAQDVMEYGMNGVINYKSGFLARLIELNSKKNGISFTENLPPIFKHETLVFPTLATPHLNGHFNFNGKIEVQDLKIQETYNKVIDNIEIIKKFNENNKNNNSKLYNAAKFMLAGNYNVAFADFDDWDTHAMQNSRMNNLLDNLNLELKSFKDAIGQEKWNKTLVVVMSEFGRVVKQNGTGTDHGHGNLLMLMGGVINKSKIHGDWLKLSAENLHEKRELPVLYENRNILAEVFGKTYGLNKEQIKKLFPDCRPTNFNIL